MADLAIHDTLLEGERVHVVVSGDRVETIVPATAPAPRALQAVDAGGGALLPGLHDHHIHLLALAAARRSVLVGPPAVADAGALVATLRAVPGHGWVRGVGYHESVAGDLDRRRLDDALATRPVRLQHRSGAMWILNTAALTAVGAEHAGVAGIERDARGRPTGRLYGADAWLRETIPPEPLDLAAVGRELASYGVTGVTDATPTERRDDLDVLGRAHDHGELPQRVVVTGGPALAAEVLELERGPVKLVVADHRLPALDELATAISCAHGAGRPVAIHCVTRPALLLALAAWDDVGSIKGDRVEHGSVIPIDQIERIAQLGLTVVTQPDFVAERGDDYLADVEPDEVDDLYRCASLRAGGVAVAGGTDAPYGHPDPWRAMAAAVDRQDAAGAPARRDGAAGTGLRPGPLPGTVGRPGRSATTRRRRRPGRPLPPRPAPLRVAGRAVVVGRPADGVLGPSRRRECLIPATRADFRATLANRRQFGRVHESRSEMELKPGTRLRSQVCSTEVIVVRPPSSPMELMCGGHPMIPAGKEPEPGLTKSEGEPSLLGKRYTNADESLEVLVTKAGEGTLADGATPLVLKAAKPLPSSD